MAEFYTNLPQKDKDNLQNTIDKLKTVNYQEEYQFMQENMMPRLPFLFNEDSKGNQQNPLPMLYWHRQKLMTLIRKNFWTN